LGDFFVAPLLLTVKRFRHNVALVSERIAAARFYASKLKENAIVYTYWFDELAITASFIKQFRPDIKWVSRAHGFDVYKEQSDDDFLFFKQNKLAWIDKLFVVSKNGFEYSKNEQPRYASKMSFSYLGTKSFGPSSIPLEDTISIVSCAFIRDIKRLDLLMDSLALIKNKK